MKVTRNGSVRWDSYKWVYVSASLQGKYIGALEIGKRNMAGISLKCIFRNLNENK
ncbi:MAG: hypothetical protein NXI09_09700 [Bacteroidetes bacterium]|nr:hypothetical protein [Bacteroidota bacterium]